MTDLVGCDLGGTNIKAVLVDIAHEKVLYSKNAPTLAYEGHTSVIEIST